VVHNAPAIQEVHEGVRCGLEGSRRKDCRPGAGDRSYKRCDCTFYVEGTLRMDGFVRKSTSETKEQKAEEWERKREDAGTLIVALPPETAAPRGAPTVEYVLQQFMNDRKAFPHPGGTPGSGLPVRTAHPAVCVAAGGDAAVAGIRLQTKTCW
jgi:hypothetical protein